MDLGSFAFRRQTLLSINIQHEYGIHAKLIIPLTPKDRILPIPFYEENGNVSYEKLSWHQPAIIDVNTQHGGFLNNSETRSSLQFIFDNTHQEIVEMIRQNRFLKNFGCELK